MLTECILCYRHCSITLHVVIYFTFITILQDERDSKKLRYKELVTPHSLRAEIQALEIKSIWYILSKVA